MEEPARRRVIDALSELKANSENSAIVYPFQRLKGNGTIRFDQKSYKGKLDFRLRKDEFKKFPFPTKIVQQLYLTPNIKLFISI